MPERMPAYRVDEARLRQKLQAYTVEVDPVKCDAIEQEAADIRYKKAIKLPGINFRVLVPVVLAIILLTVVALNFDSITTMFGPAEKSEPLIQQTAEPEPANTAPVSQPPADTWSTPGQSAATNSTVVSPPAEQPAENRTENPVTLKKPDTAVQETTAKKATPVVAQPPPDSAARVGENPQDTAIQKSEEPVKKKKRRKRRDRVMDELKESTLEPSSADDSVMVPE